MTATDSDHSGVQLRSGTRTDAWLGAACAAIWSFKMRFQELHLLRTVKIGTDKSYAESLYGIFNFFWFVLGYLIVSIARWAVRTYLDYT